MNTPRGGNEQEWGSESGFMKYVDFPLGIN
jgi:hypothetical protein